MKVPCSNCSLLHYKRPRDLKATKSGDVFCSTRCHLEARSRLTTKHFCNLCGCPLKQKQKYCSRSCSNKARTGSKYGIGQPNNRQKLIANLKTLLKEQRGDRCERCGYNEVPAILVFHHKVERANGGADSIENGELLCPNCHAKHHYQDT
jgi:hypothetical protein